MISTETRCANCGHENDSGAKFCVQCGGAIGERINKSSPLSSPIKKGTHGKTLFILLAVISGIAALVFFFLMAGVEVPSMSTYELALAFGDTSHLDSLFSLPPIFCGLIVVFSIAMVAFFAIGLNKGKKKRLIVLIAAVIAVAVSGLAAFSLLTTAPSLPSSLIKSNGKFGTTFNLTVDDFIDRYNQSFTTYLATSGTLGDAASSSAQEELLIGRKELLEQGTNDFGEATYLYYIPGLPSNENIVVSITLTEYEGCLTSAMFTVDAESYNSAGAIGQNITFMQLGSIINVLDRLWDYCEYGDDPVATDVDSLNEYYSAARKWADKGVEQINEGKQPPISEGFGNSICRTFGVANPSFEVFIMRAMNANLQNSTFRDMLKNKY